MYSIKVICVLLLTISTCIIQAKYAYHDNIQGWLGVYKVGATWEQAYERCWSEGAMLASPTTIDLRRELIALIGIVDTPYFIGTSSIYYPGDDFLSIDNINIDDMPVTDMIAKIDGHKGECLAMTTNTIEDAECTSRLPYICYKKADTKESPLPICGTNDEEYKFVNNTGKCYKMHKNLKTWDDAFETCAKEDAYLVVFKDEEELRKVKPIIELPENKIWMHVGLRQWRKIGDWMTIYGEPADKAFNTWYTNKGFTSIRLRENYNCGNLRVRNGTLTLSDALCSDQEAFLCERSVKNIRYSYEKVKDYKIY